MFFCCYSEIGRKARAFFSAASYRSRATSAWGRGCAKNPARDLAALVVLEERGLPEAPIDAVSAERGGRAYVIIFF